MNVTGSQPRSNYDPASVGLCPHVFLHVYVSLSLSLHVHSFLSRSSAVSRAPSLSLTHSHTHFLSLAFARSLASSFSLSLSPSVPLALPPSPCSALRGRAMRMVVSFSSSSPLSIPAMSDPNAYAPFKHSGAPVAQVIPVLPERERRGRRRRIKPWRPLACQPHPAPETQRLIRPNAQLLQRRNPGGGREAPCPLPLLEGGLLPGGWRGRRAREGDLAGGR